MDYLAQAKHSLIVADHILSTVYKITQEPKILINALDNVFMGLSYAISEILHYERTYRRIPPYHDTFESKFNMFQMKIVSMYKFTKKDVTFIKKVHSLVVFHKHAPVEFSRKSEFVMYDEQYAIEKLSENLIKEFITQARAFINVVGEKIHDRKSLSR